MINSRALRSTLLLASSPCRRRYLSQAARHPCPSNRFVFVPHIAGNGPNAIFQFRFDAQTGRLTPNSPAQVSPERPDGPRHFCFHPSKNLVYFSNEQGCSVTTYALDTATGLLMA